MKTENYININGQKVELTDEQVAQLCNLLNINTDQDVEQSNVPVDETCHVDKPRNLFIEHLARVICKDDIIKHAAYQLAVALLRTDDNTSQPVEGDEVIEWDMNYIDKIIEAAKKILLDVAGRASCHPYYACYDNGAEVPCYLIEGDCKNIKNCPLRKSE